MTSPWPLGLIACSSEGPSPCPGLLPHGDEDAAVGEDRRSDDGAARKDAGARKPAGVLRVAVESPEFATRRRVVGAQPAVAAAEEHLRAPVDVGRHGAAPLAVQHMLARADGAPDHLARVLVHRDQARGARRGNARVAFVLAVGGGDHQQIAHGQHLAVGGFMRKDAQAAAHVQFPDDVGRSVVLEDLFPIRAVVLAVAETLRVEAAELALGGDVVQAGPLRRAAHWSSRAAGTPAGPAPPAGPRPARGNCHPSPERP